MSVNVNCSASRGCIWDTGNRYPETSYRAAARFLIWFSRIALSRKQISCMFRCCLGELASGRFSLDDSRGRGHRTSTVVRTHASIFDGAMLSQNQKIKSFRHAIFSCNVSREGYIGPQMYGFGLEQFVPRKCRHQTSRRNLLSVNRRSLVRGRSTMR